MSARDLADRRLAHDDSIHACAFLSTSPPTLVTGGVDETLKFWPIPSTSSPSLLSSPALIIPTSSSLSCISIVPSPLLPSLLYASFLDGSVRSFSSSSAEPVHSLPSQPGEVWALAHHPTLPLLATAGAKGGVVVWRVKAAGSAIPEAEKERQQESRDIALSRQAWQHDALASAVSTSSIPHALFSYAVAFSPSGSLLATAHHSGCLAVYDAASSRLLHVFTPHSAPCRSLAFTPDSSLLVSGGDDGLLCLHSTLSMQQTASVTAHSSFVTALLTLETAAGGGGGVAPAVRHVVTGSLDRKVKVWELQHSGPLEAVHVFDSGASVWCLARLPAERVVAVGGEDGGLRLYQLPS